MKKKKEKKKKKVTIQDIVIEMTDGTMFIISRKKKEEKFKVEEMNFFDLDSKQMKK